jgi:hypothetical protein
VTYAVSSERFAKQLELLKAASGVSRIAVLWDLDIELFRRAWGRAAARSRSGPGARGSGAGPSS